MRKLKYSIYIALVSLFVVPSGFAQDASPQQRMEMEKEAQRAFREFAGLIKAGEFGEAASFYADDPRFLWAEDGSIKYDTQDQIRRALEGIASQGKVETLYGSPRVWALSDEQVNVFVKFKTTVVTRKKGETYSFSGAFTAVMEKTEAGWQFITGHTSTTPADKGF